MKLPEEISVLVNHINAVNAVSRKHRLPALNHSDAVIDRNKACVKVALYRSLAPLVRCKIYVVNILFGKDLYCLIVEVLCQTLASPIGTDTDHMHLTNVFI